MAVQSAAIGTPRRLPARARKASSVSLAPIARETVQERVYRELRKALIYGKFGPGQTLTIHELANSLETSTMPVRDALARLVSEQALEAMPNRSVRVPRIDAGRIDDLLRARVVIEGAALELAATRLTPDDFEALRGTNRDYSRAVAKRGRGAIEGALEANRRFHFHLYEASGSAVLLPIIESLWLQSGSLVRSAVIAFDAESQIAAPHYHAQIVAALEAKNVAAALSALASDIGRAFALLRGRIADAAVNSHAKSLAGGFR
jgi:DNA-binding GntR family transcriptional regulator